MKLLVAPHNDDAELFAAFTMLREKPLVLVVTDSFIQFNRGDGITWQQRRKESEEACLTLGCKVVFGGIPDTLLTEESLRNLFIKYKFNDTVYIPAYHENGNEQHNMINKVAKEMFANIIEYTNYSKDNLHQIGRTEIKPTAEELDLKEQALFCYQSQLRLPSTRPHFEVVKGKSEYYA